MAEGKDFYYTPGSENVTYFFLYVTLSESIFS